MLWVVAAEKKSIWLWPEKILATTNFYIATMPLYMDKFDFRYPRKTFLYDFNYTSIWFSVHPRLFNKVVNEMSLASILSKGFSYG